MLYTWRGVDDRVGAVDSGKGRLIFLYSWFNIDRVWALALSPSQGCHTALKARPPTEVQGQARGAQRLLNFPCASYVHRDLYMLARKQPGTEIVTIQESNIGQGDV